MIVVRLPAGSLQAGRGILALAANVNSESFKGHYGRRHQKRHGPRQLQKKQDIYIYIYRDTCIFVDVHIYI